MRRNNRAKAENKKSLQDKIIMYSIIGVGILAVILVGLLMYSRSLKNDVQNGMLSLEEMAKANEQNTQNISNAESVSTDIGKSVNEMQNETNTANATNETNANTSSTNNTTNTNNTSTSNKTNSTNSTGNTANSQTTKATEKTTTTESKTETKKVELEFTKPVEGDIIKEYAKDNLVYSNTLQEWTTHLGVDIKADKTTVVKSAEAGTVKAIKNDPRYGLTIVIEHNDGYQTVYSNLLSSEFVVEGEKVEKGQSIGTVGNTAAFEVSDEAHLHFEILKDNVQVDPNIYLK